MTKQRFKHTHTQQAFGFYFIFFKVNYIILPTWIKFERTLMLPYRIQIVLDDLYSFYFLSKLKKKEDITLPVHKGIYKIQKRRHTTLQ